VLRNKCSGDLLSLDSGQGKLLVPNGHAGAG
jgi:hypothetical protein